jgi:hypothetical protein
MSNDDLESTDDTLISEEEVFGQSLGEITVTLIAIVNLLRQQPGFDDAKFLEDIQVLLNNATEASSHTKIVLSYFIENFKPEDKVM